MKHLTTTKWVLAACVLVSMPQESISFGQTTKNSDAPIEAPKDSASRVETDQSGDSETIKQPEKKVLNADQQKQLMQSLAQQSQEANSAKGYTTVIEACEKAIRENGLLSANETYIRSLIAWSLNRRGELRMELGLEFERVSNTTEAASAFSQAEHDFDQAIAEDSTHWKAFLNRGIIRSQKKQWNEAYQDFQVSVKLRPTQTYAYFNLAEIEYQRNHFNASLAYYDQILKSSENDVQAMNGRALALAGLNRFDEALSIFDKLIDSHPEDAQLLTNRGDIYQATGQWSLAEQAYVEALKHQQTASIYRRLAWLFATCPDESIRQLDGALVLAKKSISLSRKTSAAQWDTLGAAKAVNGEFRDAIDCMKKALELEPENTDFSARQELYGQSQLFLQSPKVAKKETELLDR